jgi:NAD(P)-dependent dehydrogenase (short-subunit alcohol dehydrogenase family)
VETYSKSRSKTVGCKLTKLEFDVNTISPIFFFLALRSQLENGQSKKVIAISSFLASSDFHKATDGVYAFTSYSTAKAALNMASLKLHHESVSNVKVVRDTKIVSYRDDGFIFITLNPGYVYTDLHEIGQARSVVSVPHVQFADLLIRRHH